MKTRAALLAAALTLAAPAWAHDTWFEPRTGGTLALGTGNRFPVTELAVDDQYFVKSGCSAADGSARALDKVRFTDTVTLLRAQGGAVSCHVQLTPFDVDLPPDKISVYFAEIRPSAAVLAAWEALRLRGLPFRERYVKSARIDLGAGAAVTRPAGTALDAMRLEPAGPLTVNSEAVFQVLRDGRPLPDFNVELVNERSPVGLWHRTDAQGRVRARLPLPGRWLLRGTDLHVPSSDPQRFDSLFITYAFEVGR
jgi:Domain of unknown function (DUF4198)